MSRYLLLVIAQILFLCILPYGCKREPSPARQESSVDSAFKPPLTISIYNIIQPVTNYIDRAVDLDKDTVLSIPDKEQKPDKPGDNVKWLVENGGDLVAGFQDNDVGLMGFSMISETLPARVWAQLSRKELLEMVSNKQIDPNGKPSVMKWNKEGEQPVYAFATKNNSIGLLQIVSVDEKNKKIEL
jgi:hypothetical protein